MYRIPFVKALSRIKVLVFYLYLSCKKSRRIFQTQMPTSSSITKQWHNSRTLGKEVKFEIELSFPFMDPHFVYKFEMICFKGTYAIKQKIGLGLWCLTPFSTIFQLYRGDQFYWWRKSGVHRENYRPVASHWQTLSHNVVHLALIEIWTQNISGDRHWLHR